MFCGIVVCYDDDGSGGCYVGHSCGSVWWSLSSRVVPEVLNARIYECEVNDKEEKCTQRNIIYNKVFSPVETTISSVLRYITWNRKGKGCLIVFPLTSALFFIQRAFVALSAGVSSSTKRHIPN